MKQFVLLAASLIAIPGILAGQARGVITDTRMIVEKAGSAPDTTFEHTYAAGERFRSEHPIGTRQAFSFGNDSATVQIMTFSDSGMTMYFLNPAAKTYTVFQPSGMMRGAMEMLKSMGSEMKSRMTVDSTAIDSLGDGGIIAGYRTIHFRTRFTMGMAMSFLGDSVVVRLTDTVDTYVAPALLDARDSSANKETLEQMKRSLGGLIPFQPGDLLTRLSATGARISKVGVPLKTVNTIRTRAMGRDSFQRMTSEALKFERAVLPNSLFQVPPDYKKVDSMFRFHPDSSGARTSQSLRTPF